MEINMQQNNIGANSNGKMIGKMSDNYEAKEITIGLSAEEVTQLLQGIESLRKDDRAQLEDYLRQINEAKTQDDKKSLAQKAAEFMRQRGWGIFRFAGRGRITRVGKQISIILA